MKKNLVMKNNLFFFKERRTDHKKILSTNIGAILHSSHARNKVSFPFKFAF